LGGGGRGEGKGGRGLSSPLSGTFSTSLKPFSKKKGSLSALPKRGLGSAFSPLMKLPEGKKKKEEKGKIETVSLTASEVDKRGGGGKGTTRRPFLYLAESKQKGKREEKAAVLN